MPSFPPESTLLLYFSSIFYHPDRPVGSPLAVTYVHNNLNITARIVKIDRSPFTGEEYHQAYPGLRSFFRLNLLNVLKSQIYLTKL